MSYLLDDKKLLLKDVIAKNENLLHDKEDTELENDIFLSLIENYEAQKKTLKIIQYIHYVCTKLYEYEHEINFDVNRNQFFTELENFLDNYFLMFKESFNSIIGKSKNEKEETEIETQLKNKRRKGKEERQEEEEHTHSIYQNEVILKNNLYDVDIEEIILHNKHRYHETGRTNEITEINIEAKTEKENEKENENEKEIENEKENENEKDIEKENENDRKGIYKIETDEKEKRTDDVSINLCKKIKEENLVDKTSCEFFENEEKTPSTNSSKEKKICINWSEEAPKDNFVITQFVKKTERKNCDLLNMKEKQQLVLNEIEKLKNEIKKISLYFENTQIIINSMVCQSKIFLFELEEERKIYEAEKERIKSDKNLMKKRKMLNEISNSDQNIKENEKKEKEIKSNIEKKNVMLNEIDELIVSITDEIETAKKNSNKISEEENSDIINNHSIWDCIQLNRDISAVEKKIKFYQRKIDTLRNVKTRK